MKERLTPPRTQLRVFPAGPAGVPEKEPIPGERTWRGPPPPQHKPPAPGQNRLQNTQVCIGSLMAMVEITRSRSPQRRDRRERSRFRNGGQGGGKYNDHHDKADRGQHDEPAMEHIAVITAIQGRHLQD